MCECACVEQICDHTVISYNYYTCCADTHAYVQSVVVLILVLVVYNSIIIWGHVYNYYLINSNTPILSLCLYITIRLMHVIAIAMYIQG